MFANFDASTEYRWVVSRIVLVVGTLFLIVLWFGLAMWVLVYQAAEGIGVALFSWLGATEQPLWIHPVLAYLGFLVLPTVLFLPVLLPLALTWKRPCRIVVFRRFNTPQESKALRRIAARHLARFGHVFTLADSGIHKSLLDRIPVLLGQLSFLHFRLRKVQHARGLKRMKGHLDQRWRLNLNWLTSFHKLFPIESSDEFWQACVGVLLEKAELVVMDVSSFSNSMAWEIGECCRRGMSSKTVLLAGHERIPLGETLRAQFDAAMKPNLDSLFVYGGAGLEKPEAFRQKVAEILTLSRGTPEPASRWQVLLTIVATLASSVALAVGGLALTAPYLYPDLAGMYSPVKSQMLTAYLGTANPAVLSRMLAIDREWTLKSLRQAAWQQAGVPGANALRAVAQVGDERDVRFLTELVAASSPAPGSKDAEPLKSMWKWPNLEVKSLSQLVKRLGKPALQPLLDAIAAQPRMVFNYNLEELYTDYIKVNAAGSERLLCEPLLSSPNQTGRFIAGLELAPLGDRRTIPILLEMLRASAPGKGLSPQAEELLPKFRGVNANEESVLSPYILGNDQAADHAAILASSGNIDVYLATVLRNVPAGQGQSLLNQLVRNAQGDNPALVGRAHKLLAGADQAWVKSLLGDQDGTVSTNAAYAFAELGDPVAVPALLKASKIEGRCEVFLVFSQECNPYSDNALAALELMRERLRPPKHLRLDPESINALNQPILVSLIRLTLRARDEESAKVIFETLRPSSREVDRGALVDLVRSVETQSFGTLVKYVTRTSGSQQTAWLSGLSEGLQWRALDSRGRLDFCAAAKAQSRPDLITAWSAAGYSCSTD